MLRITYEKHTLLIPAKIGQFSSELLYYLCIKNSIEKTYVKYFLTNSYMILQILYISEVVVPRTAV